MEELDKVAKNKKSNNISDGADGFEVLQIADSDEGVFVLLFIGIATGGFFLNHYITKFFNKKFSKEMSYFLRYIVYVIEAIFYGSFFYWLTTLNVDVIKIIYWLLGYVGVLILIAICILTLNKKKRT